MANFLLVRHGQASLGADDYDQLSPLGYQQCEALGRSLKARGLTIEAVLTGTLRRHQQSWQALSSGWGDGLPQAHGRSGLNEYSSEALLQALSPQELAPPRDAQAVKQHFRALREALLAWMEGRLQAQGMVSHADFIAGARASLAEFQHLEGTVLVVSSGGPIANLVGSVMRTPHEVTIDLNMYLYNASVTELLISPRRSALLGFNQVSHLQLPGQVGWVTHA